MHQFAELIDGCAALTLTTINERSDRVMDALKTSASTVHVKNLQTFQLTKVVVAVGMFSIFEALLQERLSCEDGFSTARECLKAAGEADLGKRFSQYASAINVLKHGRGRSYDALLADIDTLPFRLKRPGENFFFEGDVSEVSTLVEVDDQFVSACADVIRDVALVIGRLRPDAIL